MELDRVPLWRGDSVPVKQLAEDFARYLYLPRLSDPSVLVHAVRDGVALLTWSQDSFAYAESYDEAAGRYRGLCSGRNLNISDHNSAGLLVKPEVALKQLDAEAPAPGSNGGGTKPEVEKPERGEEEGGSGAGGLPKTEPNPQPRRYHGTVSPDPTRVGRDAGRIADEVIAHLEGLVGSTVTGP